VRRGACPPRRRDGGGGDAGYGVDANSDGVKGAAAKCHPRPEEQPLACTLVLRAPPYLPLRTFRDSEVEAGQNAQADPVLGILGALDDLPEAWRGLVQLVLRPAPDDWCRDYLRLTVEHPLASERSTGRADTSLTQVFGLAGLLVAGALAVQGHHWYVKHDWPQLAELLGGGLLGLPGVIWLAQGHHHYHRKRRLSPGSDRSYSYW